MTAPIPTPAELPQPMFEPEHCDHERRIHMRAVVLFAWFSRGAYPGEGTHYAIVRCYACGKKWTEAD